MIPAGAMAGLGGAAGGSLLGQLVEALGAPRRGILGMLGQGLAGRDDIESGSALLEALGAEPGGLGSTLGGFGVDTLADPMTYSGMIAGLLAPGARGASTLARVGEGLGGAGAGGVVGATEGAAESGALALQKAARAAAAANEASGAELGTEALQRLGRAVTPEDVAAAGPRTGLYARNPGRATGLEEASTVSGNVRAATGPKRAGMAQARGEAMAGNRTANDMMLEEAMKNYGQPYQAGQQAMALPGQMLSPLNPARGNPLMQMEPNAALQGLEPLLAAMQQGGRGGGGMSPWDLAMMGGMGAGGIGGGIYAGMQRRGR